MMRSPKPILFVAMPFGKKRDPTSRYEIDFDLVYTNAIHPAAEGLGLDIVRADEEFIGGFVHTAMYERLLLSEIVLADLTLANANVFYELGIRHAARPRATILTYAKVGHNNQLPFDIAPIRAVPYELEEGALSVAQAEELMEALRAKFTEAKRDKEVHDSPLFQLIQGYPGIQLSHEVTETFRDRVVFATETRDALKKIRQSNDKKYAAGMVGEVAEKIFSSQETLPELLIDLLWTYRDLEAWDELVELVDNRVASPLDRASTVQEQLALALNRRNGDGDRNRAIKVLQGVLEASGPSSETFGILGRIYKDQYEERLSAGDGLGATGALDEAINCYREGFEADPRDYYPGINLLTLLLTKGDGAAREEFSQVLPVVSFAVARRGGLTSRDYWDVATVLEIAALTADATAIERAAARAITIADAPWQLRTTARNMRLVYAAHQEQNDILIQVAESFEKTANEMRL